MNRDESIALFEKCEAARKKALDEGKSEDEAHGAARAVWNGWAKPLLEERRLLEESGAWEVSLESEAFGRIFAINDKTRAWIEKADLDFTYLNFLQEKDNLKKEAHGNEDRVFTKTLTCHESAVRFDGYTFPGAVNFKDTRFFGNVNFTKATFSGNANFTNATFSGYSDYHSVMFSMNVTFENVKFSGDTDFGLSTFSGTAYFENTKFDGNASFWSLVFSQGAKFKGAEFSKDANFSYTKFSWHTSFNNTTFTSLANFENATFSERVEFKSVLFSAVANYQNVKFTGNVSFRGATFVDDINFASVMLSKYANFSDVTFSRYCSFWKTTFNENVSFSNSAFYGEANFSFSVFDKYVNFSSSVFKSSTTFNAIESQVSFNLSNTEFHKVPDFLNAKFKDEEPPNLDNVKVHTKSFWTFGYDKDPELATKFRKLKKMAIQAHYSKGELEFHAQELRSERFFTISNWFGKPIDRRNIPIPKFNLTFFFGLFYGLFSNFGRSVLRPVIAWFILIILFASFYLGQHPPVEKEIEKMQPGNVITRSIAYKYAAYKAWKLDQPCIDIQDKQSNTTKLALSKTNAPSEAFYLSLKNGFVFIDWDRSEAARRTFGCLYGFEKDGSNFVPIVPYVVSVANIIQNVLSAILIFLFGLAIRNMLKLK